MTPDADQPSPADVAQQIVDRYLADVRIQLNSLCDAWPIGCAHLIEQLAEQIGDERRAQLEAGFLLGRAYGRRVDAGKGGA